MSDQWETFCDVCYYHMWRLRRKTERGWNDGFHIKTKAEAEGLCELLNKLEREHDEALSDLEFRRDLFKLQEQQLNDVRVERDRLAEESERYRLEANAMMMQRDRLAEVLNDLWHNYSLTGAAYELIEQTLAAVKGGSDE